MHFYVCSAELPAVRAKQKIVFVNILVLYFLRCLRSLLPVEVRLLRVTGPYKQAELRFPFFSPSMICLDSDPTGIISSII